MMTVKEVSQAINVSPSIVYQLIESGKLKCYRIGIGRGTIRISQSQLEAYLQKCEKKGSQAKPVTGLKLGHLEL